MPSYTFKDTKTDEIIEKFMSIAAMEKYLEENPHIQHHHAEAPGISDAVRMGLKKPPIEFRELLKEISRKNHGTSGTF